VRRLVALFVIALLGATVYGLSSNSSGLNVNNTTVSSSTFRTELSAISTTPTIQCYVTALDPVSFNPGAGGASIAATGAAAWANLRVEGMAISQYVKNRFKYHPSAAQLAQAKSSLEGEMTQAALAKQYNCPETATQALALMPTEMREGQILAQASSLFLISRLNATIPLSLSSMKSYYASHLSNYDTLCVSVALVAPTSVSAFNAAQGTGATVAQLAAQFSVDPSKAKGGAYGCYAPTSSSYSGVRTDVLSTPLNSFGKTPQYISYNGGTYALFVAPTKRSTTPFATAESAVLRDLQTLNDNAANTVKQDILYQAAIAVDPAFGRWGLNSTGPTVFVPATPATVDVGPLNAFTSTVAPSYK
jgi:hypothetical protein